MAGEVTTTGTTAADAARANAQPGTNSSTQDAEHAEAVVAADVPEPRVLNGTPDPKTTTSLITMDSTDTELSTVFHVAWKKC